MGSFGANLDCRRDLFCRSGGDAFYDHGGHVGSGIVSRVDFRWFLRALLVYGGERVLGSEEAFQSQAPTVVGHGERTEKGSRLDTIQGLAEKEERRSALLL